MLKYLCVSVGICATSALAEAPHVVTDIAPIHSLVAKVMEGVGTPDLIVQPGTEVHDLALRPSDAAQIAQAEVVIWVGPDLTPWLVEPLETLAPTAATLTLLDVPGWTQILDDHGDVDPHAWLDPEVAVFWLQNIRDTLTATDPDNAAAYAANTDAQISRLIGLDKTLTAQLSTVPAESFITPHEAFGYFEARFGLTSAGTISDTHNHGSSISHLQELVDEVATGSVQCVFLETGGSADYAKMLTEQSNATIGTIDDISMGFEPGPELYDNLLGDIAQAITDCTGS